MCAPVALLAITACGPEESDDARGPASPSASSAKPSGGGGESDGGAGTAAPSERHEGGEAKGAGEAGEWPADDLEGELATDLPAPEPSADGAKKGATTVTYDVGSASEFADAILAGAASWNDRVPNVTLRKAPQGQKADIQFTVSNGWPGAEPSPLQLGKGKIIFGRKATDQGHDPIRVAAHEFGHLLGLDDKQPGPCSSLMAGKSAGTSCDNVYPNEAERQEVEANFSAGD